MSQTQIAYHSSPATNTSTAETELHPIQRLHTDLLAEIFIHCLPEKVGRDWRRSLISCRNAPLLLCKVCASWRSLAMSTPRLWQMFVLEMNGYSNASTAALKSLPSDMRNWLGRSGTLPLTIRFLLYTNSAPLISSALEVLFESSSRWESILIETTPRVSWPPISILPNLREFHGTVLLMNEFPFTSAPNLKSLSLYVLPRNPMSISSIPWNRLAELYITTPVPVFTVFELFQGCPLLDKLSIQVESSGGEDGLKLWSAPQIKQNTLRWLWLYITPGSRVAVESLTLPALEELKLGGISTLGEPYCYSQLLDLFTRSKCKLQKVTLLWPKFKPDQLLEYLKHPCFRTLSSLTIEEQDNGEDDWISVVDNKVLSQLTYSEEQDTAPLCPKLVELTFRTCYRSEVSPFADSLGKMVRSRCFGRALDEQLKSLDLFTRYPISPEDNELLELARDKGGLDLSYASGEDWGEEDSDEDWSEEGSDGDWDTTDGSDAEWDKDEDKDSNEDGANENTGKHPTEGD